MLLIIVEPARVPRVEALAQVVRDRMPRAAVWRYQASATHPLAPLTSGDEAGESGSFTPRLRLVGGPSPGSGGRTACVGAAELSMLMTGAELEAQG